MYLFCCGIQERERQKEEKRLEAIRLKEWNRPREDLELDDLKVVFPILLEMWMKWFCGALDPFTLRTSF